MRQKEHGNNSQYFAKIPRPAIDHKWAFCFLIKLFWGLKWEGLIVSQLILWQELQHCVWLYTPHKKILMIQFTCKRFKSPHIVGDNFPESDQLHAAILNIWSHFGKNKTVLIWPPPAGKSNCQIRIVRFVLQCYVSNGRYWSQASCVIK